LNFNDERYKVALQKGIVYTDDFQVKKPGAYQFRAVSRDPETGKLGSAGQFIQVPDIDKNHLALSGIVLGSPTKPETQAPTNPTVQRCV